MKNLYEKLKIIDIDEDELIELYAMEGDTARVINFQFKNKINYIDLTGCRVRINANTSNYNVIYNDLTIVDAKRGIAQLKLTTAMLQVGTTKYQLEITGPTGELKPKIMRLNVEARLNNDGAIEGSNEFGALKCLLNTIDNIDLKIKDAEEKSEDALKSANDAKKSLDACKEKINKNILDIKNLNQVKGVPENNLVCFIPPKTNRYLESFELIPEKREMIAGYCNFDESINKIGELQKFDYYSKTSKNYKEVDGIGHCNDLAYLPKTNELLVATMTGERPSNLMVLDYDTLVFKRWQPINGGNMSDTISGVAYNRERNLIIIKAGNTNIKLLDESFNIIKEISIPQSATFQSIASYGDYIYFNMNNIISVYNLESGEIINYNYNYNGEPEGSAIDINGNLFLTFCNGGAKWHCDTARVFEIDFTKRAMHGNLNSKYSDWKNFKRSVVCTQYLYFVHQNNSWNLITNEGDKNVYDLAGNNFIEAIKRNSSLDIKTRIGLLYELDGGTILDCTAISNYTAKNSGIDVIASYDRDKHIELDFFKDGHSINESDVPNNAGFRLKLSIAVHALT